MGLNHRVSVSGTCFRSVYPSAGIFYFVPVHFRLAEKEKAEWQRAGRIKDHYRRGCSDSDKSAPDATANFKVFGNIATGVKRSNHQRNLDWNSNRPFWSWSGQLERGSVPASVQAGYQDGTRD